MSQTLSAAHKRLELMRMNKAVIAVTPECAVLLILPDSCSTFPPCRSVSLAVFTLVSLSASHARARVHDMTVLDLLTTEAPQARRQALCQSAEQRHEEKSLQERQEIIQKRPQEGREMG